MATRVRLDQLITERGLAPTRSRAQALLMAGRVRVGAGDGARLDRKPGDLVDPATRTELVEAAPYVSRGGEKLAGALDAFGVDPRDRTCLDVGASTGGFTDCLLARGAARVYAIDVGRGQLAAALREDPRVISMERTHAARLDPDAPDRLRLPEPVSLVVDAVSFISLTRLLRGMAAATLPGGDLLPMVKPQFELTPRDVPGASSVTRRSGPAPSAGSGSTRWAWASRSWARSSRRSRAPRATGSRSCSCGCRPQEPARLRVQPDQPARRGRPRPGARVVPCAGIEAWRPRPATAPPPTPRGRRPRPRGPGR
ncbi:MAG: TlyA family RNA methyltransferase [Chloroflexota bacterium]